MENLQASIECLRQVMHTMALEKGITDPNVLIVSQMLDKAINEFYNVEQLEEFK